MAIVQVQRTTTPQDRRIRRVQVVWALLFFNVLGAAKEPIIPIPHKVAQLLTQGALVLALMLALSLNPRARVRPNLFLGLYTLLALLCFMMSVRLVSIGTAYRSVRFLEILAVLWLLTPWWGRRDFLLLRSQLRFLIGILVSVVLGLLISFHKAMPGHRLSGALWFIPATQLAHYMAEMTGIALLLWTCRMISRRQALWIAIPGATALVLTHTRTALAGMVLGLIVGGASLLTIKRRARQAFVVVLVVVVVVVLPMSPLLTKWLARGESEKQLFGLTGRQYEWSLVLSAPRTETEKILGSGYTNDGVIGHVNPALDGLPIDSSWFSTYQNQGIVGDILIGAIFLALLLLALSRPRGPARAIALFLIVYCMIASVTESGMGEASTYLLDLAVAASLLMPPLTKRLPLGGSGGATVLQGQPPEGNPF